MSAKYAKCPICGKRAKIEYGIRLREHHQPNGYLCGNYYLTPIPTVQEQATNAKLGQVQP